ncbi:MAG: 30S ribosomal protein S3 [Candidatus Omnitrophica bacterium]|nr:30S ribosomal protein S3 [Candidatus Omnitrophota bacterium]MBU1048153.1 30S ribosomal protein S3 [Candidatus Omnitrophota bacterium]MBU1631278.1 30S ribosomal protein S3 [Candidatus Omnitrophota bacterium]MBU1767386.1 30S ribosomal protein S3 [Candidatus Omnitrophota bacterium]MBU1889248.1 30S ribosomal protein S3 [Candidatus Omnitrophota bacterium]
MGQKVNPKGFRVGVTIDWESKWYADKDYSKLLHEDIKIRSLIKDKLKFAGVPKIEIGRLSEQVVIDVFTAKPGIVIGRGGTEVDKLRGQIQGLVNNKEVVLNIKEVRDVNTNAQLIAENVALQLEKRIPHRRAMKRAISQAMDSGAKGIKIKCKGRLGGNEIARDEEYKEGKVPLHTIRAIIDYGFIEAKTMFGTIGVKVWVYKGDILKIKTDQATESKESSENKGIVDASVTEKKIVSRQKSRFPKQKVNKSKNVKEKIDKAGGK